MAETIIVSGEEALDLILPLCTGMGYRKQLHTHQGLEPYFDEWVLIDEDSEDESYANRRGFLAVKRITDGKVFVTDFFDFQSSPYINSEDHDIDEFGGVKKYVEEGNYITTVTISPTPDVTFKSARIIETPDPEYPNYTFKTYELEA